MAGQTLLNNFWLHTVFAGIPIGAYWSARGETFLYFLVRHYV